MPNGPLKDYADQVFNLEDLIEARQERRSAFSEDVGGRVDMPRTHVDVDEALTFPHPHRSLEESRRLKSMVRPRAEDINFGYRDSSEEMLPSDYGEGYSEVLTTRLTDNADELAGEALEDLSDVTFDDFAYETTVIETPEHGGPKGSEAQPAGG